MTAIEEFAPAKVNLTLEVLGRRSDGLHALASLVAFADAGDTLTLEVGAAPGVTVSGPFAAGLAGPNILAHALALLARRAPALALGAVRLEKRLPVAAGLGGGSADAGALLRAVRRANAGRADAVDWQAMARTLGADVPVCFAARPHWMTGTGDVLAPLPGGLPPLEAVLVNPLASVPADKTARVYSALGAGPVAPGGTSPPAPSFEDRDALLAFLRTRGNALTAAARSVVPETAAVLAALWSLPRVEHAAVSGGGPTAFAILPDRAAAVAARHAIAAAHPGWWAVAVTLR